MILSRRARKQISIRGENAGDALTVGRLRSSPRPLWICLGATLLFAILQKPNRSREATECRKASIFHRVFGVVLPSSHKASQTAKMGKHCFGEQFETFVILLVFQARKRLGHICVFFLLAFHGSSLSFGAVMAIATLIETIWAIPSPSSEFGNRFEGQAFPTKTRAL